MTGHRSVYPSQVLPLAKSSSLSVQTGSEIRDAGDVEFHARNKTVSSGIKGGIERFRKKTHQGERNDKKE